MTTLHTITDTKDGVTIRVTQCYQDSYDGGHFSYVITNQNGDIIHIGQTTGGPPRGKFKASDAALMLSRYMASLDEEDRALYLS